MKVYAPLVPIVSVPTPGIVAVCPAVNASGVPSPLVSMAKPVTVSGLPSGSLSAVPSVSTLPLTGVSSVTGALLSVATGGVFEPIVSVSVALSVPPLPSLMLYVATGTGPA